MKRGLNAFAESIDPCQPTQAKMSRNISLFCMSVDNFTTDFVEQPTKPRGTIIF